MPSRRDVLRILLLGSGTLYWSAPLGSCHHTRLQRDEDQENAPGIMHQRYSAAHRFLRDHRPINLDSRNAEHHQADVVIVGSGPAGLTAATMLTLEGYEVFLIENEPIGGGAARAATYHDIHYPLAAIYFVELTDAIKQLCDFAGVVPHQVGEDAIIVDGTSFSPLWSNGDDALLPLSPPEKDALRRFRDDLLALRERDALPSYPLPETLPPDSAELDGISAATYLQRYRSPFLTSLLDMYARSSMGGTLEQINAYALLNFYGSEILAPRFTFRGGMAGLAQPILEKLGDRVYRGQTCIRVESAVNSPTVWAIDQRGRLHRYQSRVAIVTVQKFMLPWMIPELPEAQKAAMHSLQYAPFLTVHLCSREHIPLMAFDTWVPAGGKLFTDIISAAQTAQPRSSANVVSIYAPRSPEERWILQSDDVLAAYARRIADLAYQSVPSLRGAPIDEVHVFGWGHAVVVPTVGSHSGIAQTARQRFGRVLFANTDNDSAPAFENAVAAGARAAEKATEILKQEQTARG
ncbi:MAG: NAD(P)-binding protein [Candidatus Kapabacteria bacterium]|nr:NAD(P)-binding protein [Candidatus Kapabacteria bacterium]